MNTDKLLKLMPVGILVASGLISFGVTKGTNAADDRDLLRSIAALETEKMSVTRWREDSINRYHTDQRIMDALNRLSAQQESIIASQRCILKVMRSDTRPTDVEC